MKFLVDIKSMRLCAIFYLLLLTACINHKYVYPVYFLDESQWTKKVNITRNDQKLSIDGTFFHGPEFEGISLELKMEDKKGHPLTLSIGNVLIDGFDCKDLSVKSEKNGICKIMLACRRIDRIPMSERPPNFEPNIVKVTFTGIFKEPIEITIMPSIYDLRKTGR